MSSLPPPLPPPLAEVRGAAGLRPTRPRAQADLSLRQDAVQRSSAHLRVRHCHPSELLFFLIPRHFRRHHLHCAPLRFRRTPFEHVFCVAGLPGEVIDLRRDRHLSRQLEEDGAGRHPAGLQGLGRPGRLERGLLPDS